MFFKLLALTYISIGLVLNYVVLKKVPRILARYGIVRESRIVEKMVRKAGVSKKKKKIVDRRVRAFRSKVMRANLMQMLLPIAMFVVSVAICYAISWGLKAFGYPASPSIPLMGACILSPVIEMPLGKGVCGISVVWIQFMIFLLFSPWYSKAIREALTRAA